MPRQVVLDTNVVSYIYDEEPEATYYEEAIAGCDLLISFQTYEEFMHGAFLKDWDRPKWSELTRQFDRYEIVYPDEYLVLTCAELRANRIRIGKTLSVADAWIVATALTLGCPLATHDGGLADVAGLEVIQAPGVGDSRR